MACSSSLYAAHGVLRRGKACLANARQLVAALGQASSLHTLAENSCPPFAQTQAKVGSPLGQDRLNLVGFSSLAAPAGAGDLRGFGSRTVLGRRGLSTSSTSAVESEEAAPGTAIEGDEPNIKYYKVQNENVTKIANQILQLSLIEVAELTDLLKLKLGINDEVMMQQLGAHYGGPVVAVAGAGDDASGGAKEEKTAFDVKLEVFDAAKKLKVIKEVRAITGLGLKEAKDLVEKAPSEVKAGVSKEEAEEIQKKLEEVGGTVKVE